MMILNAILNTSHRRGTLFNPLISFLPISCSMELLQKIKNRKYDIFFNSCFNRKYDISVYCGKSRKYDIYDQRFYEIGFHAVSEISPSDENSY